MRIHIRLTILQNTIYFLNQLQTIRTTIIPILLQSIFSISIRRKSTIIQNFTKNHPRTYSSSHHVNHQSLHTHTHTHDMKIKLNRVKKKETQLNSSKIHRIYTGARALSKRLIEWLGPFNSQRSSFRTIFNHNRAI